MVVYMGKIKNVVLLQGAVIIYSISGVMSKQASASGENTMRFLLFFGLEFVVLGIYAIMWQQIIKHFELSVAYANRSMALVWSMLWATVLFGNTVTAKNITGVFLIIAGTIIINTGEGVRTDG